MEDELRLAGTVRLIKPCALALRSGTGRDGLRTTGCVGDWRGCHVEAGEVATWRQERVPRGGRTLV